MESCYHKLCQQYCQLHTNVKGKIHLISHKAEVSLQSVSLVTNISHHILS